MSTRPSRIIAGTLLLALPIAVLLCGCAGRPSQGVLIPSAQAAPGNASVPIYAVTNRQRSETDPGEMFNGERSDELSFAEVTVSIPPDAARKIGEVQWPTSLPGDPQRDFTTVSADYLDRPGFVTSVASAVKRSGRNKVLVFVHGFNNRFDDAVYRFAQIVHDGKVPVVPLLFTWPSRGELRLRAYTYDRESANFSRDALDNLLTALDNHPAVGEVYLLAHSMGNWIALEALRSRAIRGVSKHSKIKNVMLVAPDVDVDVFRSQLARIGPVRPPISLFVSRDDSALALSKAIWGDIPRIGDIDPDQEPYRSELQRDRINVYDLTKLAVAGDDAHDRAFEQVGSVVAMVRQRMSQGQVLSDGQTNFNPLTRLTD